MLESSALHPDYGRYSILACNPLEVLSLRDGTLEQSGGAIVANSDAGIWAALADAFAAVSLQELAGACPPYVPGWIGFVGYEVGRHVERLPARARREGHLPDARLAFYDAVLVYDAVEQSWTLVELDFDNPPAGAGLAAGLLSDMLHSARHEEASRPAPVEHADARTIPLAPATSNFTPDDYRRAVARAVEYIAAGDIFQVNLSQRFTVANAPRPLDIYRVLRKRNPSWYAAFLSFNGRGVGGEVSRASCPHTPEAGMQCAILSSSPELFLRIRGRHIVTRPIKGTRRRSGDMEKDEAAKRELLASPKDNAELAMIIDLLRNDIGRVCRYGTVRVTQARRLETHATVFHLVGTVEGELRDDAGPAAVLRATFPGGSITGAPKIRAMEIIDELEGLARGVYTGCIGIVGVDGSCEWNIAIRTVVCDNGQATVQVGGGIVADSTPDGEYVETLDKARALLEAIEQAGQSGR